LLRRKTGAIEIKGFGNDVFIILSNEASFSDIETDLINRLEKSKSFLAGVEIVLDTKDRILSLEELGKLRVILSEKFDIKIAFVRANSNETKEAVEQIGWKIEIPNQESGKMADEEETRTILIRQTIRSGQKISYPGNVVIIGDVNPGGEIEAAGDIVVFGKLRGVAHAGINGDNSSEIIALGLSPLQLRIAGIIRRSPDSNLETDHVPEVAKIKDGNIVIENLDKSRRGDG
jgi:septum site-determining protein MinC